MGNIDTLRAIETAITAETSAIPQRSPEVDAAMQVTSFVANLVNERDGYKHETLLQRQRIASLEKQLEEQATQFDNIFAQYRATAEVEIARLRAENEEVKDHATFFLRDRDRLRGSLDSIERIAERARYDEQGDQEERAKKRREVNALPAAAPFGTPRPRFLQGAPERRSGNVTDLKPVQMRS